MQIWVDADACPRVIRDILVRAANKQCIKTTFVANQPVAVTRSAFVMQWQVNQGFDEADNEIVRRVCNDDIVITQDLRLAQAALAKDAKVMSPRGQVFDSATIDSKVERRDVHEMLRESGIMMGGPATLSSRDSQQFSNQLQQWLFSVG
ncbi:YaiI/YqxD family protein [Celerinatantimonas yamalensis]|uniref:UPF0178 protein ABUE30_02135 n=1 Tax=Celerinatantimonas yamalensis TaxID=559956 RepID=A0ABW9G2G8_9GAMM